MSFTPNFGVAYELPTFNLGVVCALSILDLCVVCELSTPSLGADECSSTPNRMRKLLFYSIFAEKYNSNNI